MDARELRIGNRVQVIGIYKDSIMSAGFVDVDAELIKLCEDKKIMLLPVELSPDIMLAYGFKKVYHKTYDRVYEKYNKDLAQDWTFRTIFYRDEIMLEPFGKDCGHICIYHLHQLQNIHYSLTGEELKVQLTQPA